MKGPKILYVEDEEFLGKIVTESLESRNYQVHMVADGAKVMAAYEKFQPDICVLDIMLPNVDGFQLAEQISSLPQPPPIIFLSAKNQTEDIVTGFKSGGNDYLKKPFSLEELIARIENLLSLTIRAPKAQTGAIPVGSYTYNAQHLTLARGDQVTQLSHRENELLNYLLEHRNDIIDRKKLLLALWGDDSYFNSRNLDVYIKKLRDYLKADDQVKIITLKGIGYRFLITA